MSYQTSKSDIAFKFLCAAVFFAPLRAYGLFKMGPMIANGFKICALLMIISSLFSNKGHISNGILRTVGFLLFWDLFTLLHSSSSGLFPSYFVAHLILLFSIIVAKNNVQHFPKLVYSFILSSFIPSILGIYQWVGVMRGGSTPPLPLQRFVMETGKDDLFLYGNYRVVSTLQDPSYLGLFLAAVVILGIGVIFLRAEEFSKTQRTISIVAVGLSVLCIFMAGSVSSYVNVLIGLFLFAYLFRNFKSKLIIGIIVSVLVFVFSLLILNRYTGYNPIDVLREKLQVQGENDDMFGRSELILSALSDWSNHPIFGVGFGNMTFSSAHNSIITILTLEGIFGFIANIFLFLIVPFRAIHKYRNSFEQYPFLPIFCAVLLSMFAQTMAYDCLYKMDPVVVIMMLMFVSIEYSDYKISNYEQV